MKACKCNMQTVALAKEEVHMPLFTLKSVCRQCMQRKNGVQSLHSVQYSPQYGAVLYKKWVTLYSVLVTSYT